MCPDNAEGMANNVEPDGTAPESTAFAQTGLSENLGTLWYTCAPILFPSYNWGRRGES